METNNDVNPNVLNGDKPPLDLETRLRRTIVGQGPAIRRVGAAIRRKETGWSDANDGPLVFLHLPSNYFNRAEDLAKQIAAHRNGDSNLRASLFRASMKEYRTLNEFSRLINVEGTRNLRLGELSEFLEMNPTAVVLLEDIEAASKQVIAVLLDIFKQGHIIIPSFDVSFDCKEVIFILSSANIGKKLQCQDDIRKKLPSHRVYEFESCGDYQEEAIKHDISDELAPIMSRVIGNHARRTAASSVQYVTQYRSHISDSKDAHYNKELGIVAKLARVFIHHLPTNATNRKFLRRMDEILIFLAILDEDKANYLHWYLNSLAEKVADKHSITLTWDNDVIKQLMNGPDAYYTDQSLKTAVKYRVVSPLALAQQRKLIYPRCKVHIKLGRMESLAPNPVATETNTVVEEEEEEEEEEVEEEEEEEEEPTTTSRTNRPRTLIFHINTPEGNIVELNPGKDFLFGSKTPKQL